MTFETDKWPLIKARWFTDVPPGRKVRVIVIHTMEAPEGPQTAENVARYFANLPASTKASAHVCVDNNSVVQCVLDNDVAFAAPGANHDGWQVELAGTARQSRKQWFDEYSIDLLMRAADVVAQGCLKYGIPARKLTDNELLAGSPGIVGHDQVSRVYRKSDHTDPGPNFPWTFFLAAVREFYDIRRLEAA